MNEYIRKDIENLLELLEHSEERAHKALRHIAELQKDIRAIKTQEDWENFTDMYDLDSIEESACKLDGAF